MKVMAFLPAVAAAILALSISTASSQKACMKEFQACMDGCTNKSAKTVQDSCFQSCEGKNNMCAERVYGKRPAPGAPAVAEQKEPAKDALAKTEKQAADARDQADPKQAPQAPQQPKGVPAKR
jgi:hypothetical protein